MAVIHIRLPDSSSAGRRDVLVLRALGLGDLLTAVPALRALRRSYPHERIVLAAPDWLEPIVRMTGAVDALLPTDRLGALNWPGTPPSLAVNLHGRGPQSIADLVATRPRQLLTHRHRAFPAIAGLDWNCDLHEVDRWCRLLEFAEIAADRDDLALTVPDPMPRTDTVVIHPGAGSPARQWPPARYAEVAAHLHRRGWRVVVTGGRDETALAAAVCAAAGLDECANRAGRLDLSALATLVASAGLVICGDTGVGHLATAVATPSVLLFGPTPPRRWGPPPDARHRVLWAGDVGDPHAATPDAGLLLLTVDQVIAAAEEQLTHAPPLQEAHRGP